MVAENAITMLPPGEKPWVVSPFGLVPKRGTNNFHLAVNMRYVNNHLGKKAFKFKGLKDLADLAERGDHAVSYDLMSGHYHVVCNRGRGLVSDSSGKAYTMCIIATPSDCCHHLGYSPRR